MKKFIVKIGLLGMISGLSSIAAGASEIFNIVAINPVLGITTNIPGHVYPHAGIKVNTPGYTIEPGGIQFDRTRTRAQESTLLGNGFLQFKATATETSFFLVSGLAEANVNVTVCLNAIDPISCQSKTFYFVPSG